MTEKIENGDFALDNGNALKVDYIDEVLQDVKTALETKRGSFYPSKKFGSRLFEIEDFAKEYFALQYANEALSNFDGVFVLNAEILDEEIKFIIKINDEEREVSVSI